MFRRITDLLLLWQILKNGIDPPKPRIDDSTDKPRPWQLAEILDHAQCRQATLPDTAGSSVKVVCLINFPKKMFYNLKQKKKLLRFMFLLLRGKAGRPASVY